MITNPVARVFLVHIGFHSCWVLIYIVSLSGVFVLIPLIGWYNAFVLGFLGKSVISSSTQAVIIGYIAFAITGILSGWLISLFHLKSVVIPAVLSLLLAIGSFIGASFIRYKYTDISEVETLLPLPAHSGRLDADEISMALKVEYHNSGELPLYITGRPSTISLSEVQPLLSIQPKQLKPEDYLYCNLPSNVWKALKSVPTKHPILWSGKSDASGQRLVISVDFSTDVFSDEIINDATLRQTLQEMETAIKNQTGEPSFKLEM